MSHRFIRFQLSDNSIEDGEAAVEVYLNTLLADESGTLQHRMQ